ARLDSVEETLTRAAGLPPPTTAPLAHYSDGVHKVRLGLSHPVRPDRRRGADHGPPDAPHPRPHGTHEGGAR
ncbi:DUF2071 domain-containing protein, partial [Streptomyces sp. NPDC001356]